MQHQEITVSDLLEAMGGPVTVVTGNARLSRWLLQTHAAHATAAGATVWSTPDVLPWGAWLQRSWEDAVVQGRIASPPLLLGAEQELRLWHDIIASHSDGLLQPGATAQHAIEAWQLLHDWHLDRGLLTTWGDEDVEAFTAWCGDFEARCDRQGWLSPAALPARLTVLTQQQALAGVRELLVVGFDELTPAQVDLFDALRGAGAAVRWLQLSANEGRTARVALADGRQEIAAIAQWVRRCLAERPGCSIGIVVPDMTAHATAIDHQLTRVLTPGNLLPGGGRVARPWNLSLGRPLRVQPLIEAAFAVLRCVQGALAREDVTTLLLSPFFAGWVDEADARALLDRRLRDDGEPVLRLWRLRALAEQKDPASGEPRPWCCPVLARSLRAFERCAMRRPAVAGAAFWRDYFGECLAALAWARGRPLDSSEYQQVEAWRTLLNAFGALEPVSGENAFDEALGHLEAMASRQVFQPRGAAAAVNVLGMYESIGLRFDRLWVMGLHDGVWPARPRPNPFLPTRLQREAGLPHASVEREHAVASTLMARLVRAADEVVFSYPLRDGDESLRMSPLLASITAVDAPAPALSPDASCHGSWAAAVQAAGVLETLSDVSAPPLGEVRPVGGSGILKSQSLCPFRAFARHRLAADGFREAQLGLDPMKKGSLVHRVLELFWQQHVDQRQLLGLSPPQRRDALAQAVDAALDEAARDSDMIRHSPPFRALERDRLLRLLDDWLRRECERAPFSVIGTEVGVDDCVLEGVPVRLVIDRIDQLDDGRKVIVDYKTGNVSPSDWFGPRPDDPQLPLYSAVTGGDIAAVVFAQLRAGRLGFRGVVAEAGILPELPPPRGTEKSAVDDWPQVLDDWRGVIAALARDFAAGGAAVDPKDGLKTCDRLYCELQPLCRVHEVLPETEDGEGA